MNLAGKTYVVMGAGVAGEAVAAGLLRHGAKVAITSRTDERLQDVAAELASPRLRLYRVETFDVAGVTAMRDKIIDDVAQIDGVVAALGGWWEGPPLSQLRPDVWGQILNDNLTSHFIAARGLMPALIGRPCAVYVTLGGVAAAMPLAHAAPVSITGAAQTRLLECLAAEETGVRLHEVRILTPIVTRRWDRPTAEPDWLTGDQVGDYLAAVVSPGFPRPRQLVLNFPDAPVP